MTEHTSDGRPRSNDQLRGIVERAERITDEIEQGREDLKELMAEAKGNGFDPAAIRAVLKRRNETPEQKAKREDREAIFELYCSNLAILD